jgi:3-hydroxybutyryl-CoA dehydrogenase
MTLSDADYPVAVIGAGTMGNGIAHVFAQYGYQVTMIDVSEEAINRGLATITKNLERMVAKEKITTQDQAAILSRISTSTSIESSVANAKLIIEAATEKAELKLKIFEGLGQWCKPDAILATNTEFYFDYSNCVCNKISWASHRDAFYESCAGDEIGRSHPGI